MGFKNITITDWNFLYFISITQIFYSKINFFWYKIFILPALGLCCMGRPHLPPTQSPSPATPLARNFSAREGAGRNTIHCSVNDTKKRICGQETVPWGWLWRAQKDKTRPSALNGMWDGQEATHSNGLDKKKSTAHLNRRRRHENDGFKSRHLAWYLDMKRRRQIKKTPRHNMAH
jgi:hypothetical protein